MRKRKSQFACQWIGTFPECFPAGSLPDCPESWGPALQQEAWQLQSPQQPGKKIKAGKGFQMLSLLVALQPDSWKTQADQGILSIMVRIVLTGYSILMYWSKLWLSSHAIGISILIDAVLMLNCLAGVGQDFLEHRGCRFCLLSQETNTQRLLHKTLFSFLKIVLGI